MDSILNSIKHMLGILDETDAFDVDIIAAINTAFFSLMQLGVGPSEGFSISGSSEKWNDFIDRDDIEPVKTYVYLKTRLLFDPPQTHVVMDAINSQIAEYEWRLNVQVDTA